MLYVCYFCLEGHSAEHTVRDEYAKQVEMNRELQINNKNPLISLLVVMFKLHYYIRLTARGSTKTNPHWLQQISNSWPAPC